MRKRKYKASFGVWDTDKNKRSDKEINIFIKMLINNLDITEDSFPIHFKLDTGASEVVLTARKLGLEMTEDEYVKAYNPEFTLRNGIVKDQKVKYYIHYVDAIILGDIEIKNFPVLITFDTRTSSVLLGMSFLKLFNILIDNENKTVTFIETDKTAELLEWDLPLYDIKDNVDVQLNSLDIEANYINKKINKEWKET